MEKASIKTIKNYRQKLSFVKRNVQRPITTQSLLKVFLKKSLILHLLSFIFLEFFMLIKNLLIVESCWETSEGCTECSMSKRIYLILVHEPLEYCRPTYYFYYFVFFTNKIPNFFFFTRLFRIIFVIFTDIIYFLWKPSLIPFIERETPEDVILLLFLILAFIFFALFLKKRMKISWMFFFRENYLNLLILALGYCNAMVILNFLVIFRKLLKLNFENWEIYYQILLMFFLALFEYSYLVLFTKYAKFLSDKWKSNNSPILFFAKNFLMYSHAMRLGNFAKFETVNISFFLSFLSYLWFLIQVTTGRSLIKILRIAKLKKMVSNKIWKSRNLKNSRIKKKFDEIAFLKHTLRVLCYQKIDFLLIYVPRMINLCLMGQWTILQPGSFLNKKCTYKLASENIINKPLIMTMMGFDVCFTFLFVIVVLLKQKWEEFFAYLTEDMNFIERIILYTGYQLSFEYWFSYYLEVIEVD